MHVVHEISVLVSGFVLRASATLGVATDNTPYCQYNPVNAIEINFLFITNPPTICDTFNNSKSNSHTRITISPCHNQQHTKHTLTIILFRQYTINLI